MEDIRFIKTEETYLLRKEVLRKNIDLPYKLEGDFERNTFHLGYFVDDNLACIATFIEKKINQLIGKQFQLRGMATHEQFRGRGYGKLLIKEAEKILLEEKVELIWCNARVSAAGFYKSLNFKIIGDEFEVPKVGKHFKMIKEL